VNRDTEEVNIFRNGGRGEGGGREKRERFVLDLLSSTDVFQKHGRFPEEQSEGKTGEGKER